MLGRRKGAGAHDPGHIVPNTKGTSNEISFSVLHSMRNAAEEGGGLERPAWEFPQEEVKQRRKQRRRSSRLLVAGIVLAVMAVVALVTTILALNIQNQMDSVSRMKGILREVVAESDQLKPFDDAVSAALTAEMGTFSYDDTKNAYESAQASAPAVADRLQQLKQQLENTLGQLQAPGDREAVNQGITAINAQLNLMDMGQQAMTYALPAQEAYAHAQAAMDNILQADTLDDEATSLMSTLNRDNASASLAKTQEAQAKLTSARDDLQLTQDRLEQLVGDQADETDIADARDVIATYLSYVQLRIDAQQAAAQSMQAYLDRDKATLQQANERYNQAEQQAAQLIADRSIAPADAFALVFTRIRATDADQWTAESARADAALSAIRDYLA